jgi:hypothetical protein
MKLPSRFLLPFIALSALSACPTPSGEGAGTTESAVSGVPIGDVRGVVDITKTLQTRILANTPTAGTFDVSRVAGPVFRLRKQLGVFALEGTTSTYQGGTPTPLRATLWHQVMGRFAAAMGGLCDADPATAAAGDVTFVAYADGPNGDFIGPKTFRIRPEVAGMIRNACTFQGDEAARAALAGDLWDAFMGLGGTLSVERLAFVTESAADGAPLLHATPKDRVSNMVLSMLLNPHFLLAK